MKDDNSILVLSSTPNFRIKIQGFLNDEMDWEYEQSIKETLVKSFNDEVIRDQILEDMCINFGFCSSKFNSEPLFNKKLYLSIYELIQKLLENYCLQAKVQSNTNSVEGKPKENMINYSKQTYLLNICLILGKNLLSKLHSDKFLSDIIKKLESYSSMNEIMYYNCIAIFRKLIPKSFYIYKREDIAKAKWLISNHFDYGLKQIRLLNCKLFLSFEIIENFESINVININIKT